MSGKIHRLSPVLWMAPLALFLILFQLWPSIDVFRLSFTNMRFALDTVEYSLRSYRNIVQDPEIPQMLRTTFVFVAFSVFFQVVLGLIIALVVDQGYRLRVPGSIFARTTVTMGWAIPGIITGLIWLLLLNESRAGILTYWFMRIGIGRIPFLSTSSIALTMAVIANVWRGTASSMILQYSALQTIPKEILEAGIIDGASALQMIRYIVVGFIKPIIFMVVILNTVATFNTFDMIVSLTGGGPGRATEVIALHIYAKLFRQLNFGGGAAVAVVLLALNVGLALVYFALLRRDPRSNV